MSGPEADRGSLTPRRIAPGEWEARRWEWMESVRRDAGLSATARLVAHTLALDYANRATGECNPGPKHLAATLGFSMDTAKRAIAELVGSGWIVRETNGPGRGNAARIIFLSRAQIVQLKPAAGASGAGSASREKGAQVHPFRPQKGASTPPFAAAEKGANLRGKRGQECPPNHSKEPYTRGRVREGSDPAASQALSDAVVLRTAEHIAAGRDWAIRTASTAMIRAILDRGLLTRAELRLAGVDC